MVRFIIKATLEHNSGEREKNPPAFCCVPFERKTMHRTNQWQRFYHLLFYAISEVHVSLNYYSSNDEVF